MNEFILSKLVALRGLGYTQTYMRIMVAGVLPRVADFVGKVRKPDML